MLNMLPDDKDLKRFTDGIANTDTSMISDAIDRAKAGMSELDKKPATKPPPGPAEIKLGKEKKAIKELSDIYAAGSSDAYAMAAKANVFFAGVVSPVASAPAMPETIGIDAGNSDSGDLAGRSDYKLDLMAARLTSIDNTLAKMGVA